MKKALILQGGWDGHEPQLTSKRFAGLLEKCRDLGYQRIKLFPLKSNEATLRVMLGCGGVIAGEYADKYLVIVPIPDR